MSEKKFDIVVLVGSLRAASLNRKMAENLIEMAPESLSLRIVEIGDLPMYNPDRDPVYHPELEEGVAAWERFREELTSADGVLFLTPEYNRSIPAVLKNAIDVGSRSKSFSGLPGAIVTISPGSLGGFGANHHLRQALVFLNVAVMAQPEVYIGGAKDFFDETGRLEKEDTREFMNYVMEAFEMWVKRHHREVQ